MNKINTNHALMYFKYWLAKQQEKLQKAADLYNQAKQKYQQGLWYKLFKTKFEETSTGDKSWRGGSNWQHIWIKDSMRNIEKSINTCMYHSKMQHQELEWLFEHADINGFYRWASDNNIPY